MVSNYSNQLNASFRLWLDNRLASNGGFQNISGQLFPTTDANYSQYSIAGSPFRQWIGDSSVSGATICSQINYSGGFYTNGVWNENENFWNTDPTLWNGNTGQLTIDFERGRVVSNYSLAEPITTSYSIKNWNLYFNYLDEPSLLLQTAFQLQSPIYQQTGALNYFDEPFPCVYIQNKYQENIPFLFGGSDLSKNEISLVLITNNSFDLDSTISILANASKTYFSLIPVDQLPYDSLGGLKNATYNYRELCSQQPASQLVYIKQVKTSKFNQTLNKELGKNIRGAFIDFVVEFSRQPRRYVR